jgi:regulator of cell morphogenesis and NO signaling
MRAVIVATIFVHMTPVIPHSDDARYAGDNGGDMSEGFDKTTVGELVACDYRTAAVFERFGIDFCCGGRRTLAEACRGTAVDPGAIERALLALPPKSDGDQTDVTPWPLDGLIDHIVATHHAYTRVALERIERLLAKLVEVHGARHSELTRVAAAWNTLGHDLLQHMMKEERILFPYIREMAAAQGKLSPSPFGTVENPIRMMQREHQDAGDDMRLIRELTSGYATPGDGCTTYRLCFDELAQFERDLHRHVHLEENVLFPRAVDVERRPYAH